MLPCLCCGLHCLDCQAILPLSHPPHKALLAAQLSAHKQASTASCPYLCRSLQMYQFHAVMGSRDLREVVDDLGPTHPFTCLCPKIPGLADRSSQSSLQLCNACLLLSILLRCNQGASLWWCDKGEPSPLPWQTNTGAYHCFEKHSKSLPGLVCSA